SRCRASSRWPASTPRPPTPATSPPPWADTPPGRHPLRSRPIDPARSARPGASAGDAPQAGPREVAHLVGELLGAELEVLHQPVAAGGLGDPHDPVGEQPPPLGRETLDGDELG